MCGHSVKCDSYLARSFPLPLSPLKPYFGLETRTISAREENTKIQDKNSARKREIIVLEQRQKNSIIIISSWQWKWTKK